MPRKRRYEHGEPLLRCRALWCTTTGRRSAIPTCGAHPGDHCPVACWACRLHPAYATSAFGCIGLASAAFGFLVEAEGLAPRSGLALFHALLNGGSGLVANVHPHERHAAPERRIGPGYSDPCGAQCRGSNAGGCHPRVSRPVAVSSRALHMFRRPWFGLGRRC